MSYVRMLWSRGITCFFSALTLHRFWEYLSKGILLDAHTNNWATILQFISDSKMEKRKLFCIRYALQAALYALWRERNNLKHGEKLLPMEVLKKMIDNGVRNKLSLVRSKGIRGMEGGLQILFSPRL